MALAAQLIVYNKVVYVCLFFDERAIRMNAQTIGMRLICVQSRCNRRLCVFFRV